MSAVFAAARIAVQRSSAQKCEKRGMRAVHFSDRYGVKLYEMGMEIFCVIYAFRLNRRCIAVNIT